MKKNSRKYSRVLGSLIGILILIGVFSSPLWAEWSIETVDEGVDSEGSVGWHASLALDSNNYPHISYLEYEEKFYEHEVLKYARWTGTSWSIERVSSIALARAYWYTSIALDSNNYPHISYCRITGDLNYVKWTGSKWSMETVDSEGSVGWHASLALDSNDYPHISYRDATKGDLKYAKWTGSAWSIETLDVGSKGGRAGYNTSIALDSNDYPHISYCEWTDYAYSELKYAKWTGSEWSIETLDGAPPLGVSTSIALDSNNYPHISYQADGLNYAKWTGSEWSIETVANAGWLTPISNSIALDSNNYPHISYRAVGLKYARWTGSGWSIERVDSGYTGEVSIALDSNDYPHISSRYVYNLKYAKWVGDAPIASASASPTSGIAPLGVAFTGTGTDANGTIVKYEWDFDGNGTYDWSSTISGNTTHTYSVAGTYNAKLRVTDNDNLIGTDSVTITVSPASQPPTASASADPTSGTAPLEVAFTGTGTDSDGTIVKYEWDFDGDGTYDWSSATTGDTSYTYTEAATYKATLRVTDNDGLTDTDFVTITVSPALKPPTASASANPTSGLVPLTVNFTGTGTDSDGTIVKYEWDFDGDGTYDWSSTTSGSTTHTYEEVGTYTAKLRVTDNDNLSGTDTVSITVQQPSELKVWISVPKDGDSIWGDAVSLRANTAPGELTKSVQFQYKASSDEAWIDLGEPIIPPPYSFHYTTWDVTSLTPGNYHLRAEAIDTEDNLVYADPITLTITSDNPKIWEGKNPRGDHEKKEKVSKDKTEVVKLFDKTTVEISQGALTADTTVHTILYDATTTPVAIRRTRHILPAGIYKEFNIAEGAYHFNRDITLTIPYPDVNNDGILDGTGIKETTLAIYHYNDGTGLWERVTGSTIYLSENYISAPVNHLSLFTLVGTRSTGGANAPSSGGGGGGGGGGCLIATAAYGAPMAEEERILSEFRDRHLLTNKAGRAFVSFYNKLSPPVARFIQDKESLKAMVRIGLKPLIWIAKRTTK